jgi:hypothetical protein
MQGPGIQDWEVATLDELRDIHVATLTDGSVVFVFSENSEYRLYKNSGFVPISGDTDAIIPRPGSAIAGAAGAVWIRIGGAIIQSALTVITGATGTEVILDGTTTPRVLIPAGASENYTISLLVRRATGNIDTEATVYYQRQVTVSRDGVLAPTLTATQYVSNEEAAWPAGNADFPAVDAVLVGGQYYLRVQFTQANAATDPSLAQVTIERSSVIFS